jgi:hypothetical protein
LLQFNYVRCSDALKKANTEHSRSHNELLVIVVKFSSEKNAERGGVEKKKKKGQVEIV